MVYIVKKKIGNHEYLYLQKSYHISYHKGVSKNKTKYYAYLGKASKYTTAQLDNLLFSANHSPKKIVLKLIKEYSKRQSRT